MGDPSGVPVAERGTTLGEILAAAGIHKNSVVRVTGSAGLAALLWFARHGYRQVGYVRPIGHAASEGDLLLVPQTCGVEALEDLLSRGPCVRPGGVLIVQTPEPRSGVANDPAHALLSRCGYDIERCLHGHRRELHVARRRLPIGLAA
jgi:hypothetical protein